MHAATTSDPVARAHAAHAAGRRAEDPTPDRAALAALPPAELEAALDRRERRLALWINVYNAASRWLVADDPDRYERRYRLLFREQFAAPLVTVAGHDLSLDDVEHGILRGSMLGFGGGYLPRLRPDAFERRFRLETLDPRLHFALNCGAVSCPTVIAYDAESIDDELDRATRSYLESTVDYDPDADRATVPRHFLWYRGDFGGKAGIYEFLSEHGALPDAARPRLSYLDYDWSFDPDPFGAK